MKVQTILYTSATGWSDPIPMDLDSPNTFVVVFAAPDMSDSEPLREVCRAFPKSKLIGCSSAGEIMGSTVHDDSVAVGIARFDITELRSVLVRIDAPSDSFETGVQIAEYLNAPSLKSVFVLSDGLNVNGSKLVAGLSSVLPSEVVATGGLAGDEARFESTWVLKDGQITSNAVVAVGFYGDHIDVRHGSNGGWDIFGPERKVTRSVDNQLFELDGKPALELYKLYLGELSSGLPASGLLFPLSVRSANEGQRIVRTILNVDENSLSMTFAGDIPEGSYVQLMRANLDRLIDGAISAAEMTRTANDGEVLSVAISCVGRRLILGERTEDELEAVTESLPTAARQIGFYSFGEISPNSSGVCELHNQTMTLTTFRERGGLND